MAENNNDFDPFDPTGMFKEMRNSNMDAWAKAMTHFVNTDAYAKASGEMLDSWLSNSAPLRKALETSLSQTLANLNMPSREDVSRLAERLTHIEMRLDDLEAMLEEHFRQPAKATKGRQTKTHRQES